MAARNALSRSEVTDRVLAIVKNFQQIDPSKVTLKSHFLHLDSLDYLEVLMALEAEFGFEIPDEDAEKFHSIDLIVDYISSHPQAK